MLKALKITSFRGFGTLVSVACAFIVGALIILVMGYDPAEAYRELFKGAFLGRFSFGTTLEKFSPILLTGFGYAVCIKVRYFNLGLEGCLYMGGIISCGIGLITGLPMIVHIPLGLICGALAGSIWAGIPGILRVRYNVNEACSTIMLNYVAVLFTSFMLFNVWREVMAIPRTPFIQRSAQFVRIQSLRPSRVSYAIFLLIIVWLFVYWIVYKTSFGFKLRATGSNLFFSSYIGYHAKRTVLLTVCLGGAIGGFAGSIEIMGIYYCVWDTFSNWTAFDGMLASLIAKNDVRKLPFSAFILAALRAGALGMERFSGIPKSLIDTLVPIMIILIAMEGIYETIKSFQPKKIEQSGASKEGN